MKRFISAELLALRSTRTVWSLAACSALFSTLSAWANLYAVEHVDSLSGDSQAQLLQSMGMSTPWALMGGVIGATGVYRYGTIIPRAVYVPRRERLFAARIVAHAIAGFGYAAVSAVAVLVTLAIMTSLSSDVSVSLTDYGTVMGGSLLVGVVYATFGVAVGDLVRNQTVGVLLGLVYVLFVENSLLLIAPRASQFLPGGLQRVLLHTPGTTGSPTLAVLLLIGYAAGLAWLVARVARRDIA